MTKQKEKQFKVFEGDYPSLLKYPFKSKFKWFEDYIGSTNPNIVKEPYVPDYKLGTVKKLSKPDFSYEPGCWEMDLMFVNYFDPEEMIDKEQIYLVLVNVNTRFLIVRPVKSKSYKDINGPLIDVMLDYVEYEYGINTIKCDGEKAFVKASQEIIVYYDDDGEWTSINNLTEHIKNTFKTKRQKDIELNKGTKIKLTAKQGNILKTILDNKPKDEEVIQDYLSKLKKSFDEDITIVDEDDELVEIEDGEDSETDEEEDEDEDEEEDEYENYIDYYIPKWVIQDSKYSLSHKIVDATIRTLRNAFGLDNRRLANPELMKQMVDFYNNTPHRSLRLKTYAQIEDREEYIGSGLEFPKQSKYIYLTPLQMQTDIELEWRYIRMMMSKLQTIKEKQQFKGLLTYRQGNIILVHLDKGKTEKKHEKRRRVFDEIAEFIHYKNGNVVCKLLKPYTKFIVKKDEKDEKQDTVTYQRLDPPGGVKDIIEVPIIYTKYVCKSRSDIPNDYKQYFNLI